jgi:hypothetical protein
MQVTRAKSSSTCDSDEKVQPGLDSPFEGDTATVGSDGDVYQRVIIGSSTHVAPPSVDERCRA